MRFNDREGPGGEKTLHIEEIQSDWHQQGREKGYFHTGSALGGRTRVPDAPFKDTWHELALKRMLHYAAAGGYERVTLNSGEQINRVLGGPDPGSLPGQQAFYDKMLPNTLAKLIKPLGGKVELANMVSGSEPSGRFPAERGGPRQDTYADVSSLLLTPEMRKSILEKGFPLLAGGGLLREKVLRSKGLDPDAAFDMGKIPEMLPDERSWTRKHAGELALRKQDMVIARKMARLLPHHADGGILPHLAFGGFKPTSIYQSNPLVPILAAAGGGRMPRLAGGFSWPRVPRLPFGEAASPGHLAQIMRRQLEHEEAPDDIRHAMNLLKASSSLGVMRHVPEASTFLGAGIAAVAFRMPDGNVIRLQPAIAEWLNAKRGARLFPSIFNTERPNIKGVLPALGAHVEGRGAHAVHLEITPFSPNVDYRGYSDAHLADQARLERILERQGYGLQDSHPGNLGIYQGKTVVRDPGSVFLLTATKAESINPFLPRQKMMTPLQWAEHYEQLQQQFGIIPELQSQYAGYLRSYVRESQELPRLAGGGLLPNLLSRLWQHWGGGQGLATAYGASTAPALLGGIAGAAIGGPVGGLVGSTVGRIGGMIGMAELLAQERGKPRRRQPLLSKPGLEELPHLASGLRFPSEAIVRPSSYMSPEETTEVLRAILGRRDIDLQDAAAIVGAPKNSTVTVQFAGSVNKPALRINTLGEHFSNQRVLERDRLGNPFIKNDLFEVDPKKQGSGIGKIIFGQQVANAQDLGVSYLATHAAKMRLNPMTGKRIKPDFIGYHIWPKFGYDQSIADMHYADKYSRTVYNRLKKQFPQAQTIRDVFDAPGGSDWWLKNGWDLFSMKFNLSPGSRSMRAWEEYQNSKKKKVVLPGSMGSPLFSIGSHLLNVLPKMAKGGRLPRLEEGAALGACLPMNWRPIWGNRLAEKISLSKSRTWRAAEARRQAASGRSPPEHDAMAQAMAFVGGTANLGRALRLLDHSRLKKWWRPDLDLSTEELHGRQSLAFIGLGPSPFLAKGGRLPRLAAGGAPDGSLEAIAGEVAPELFRHKGRNYIVSNPGPGVHITMEPGDFVLPRGKRVEDLPRLAGGGALPRLADGGTHGAFPIGTGNSTNQVYIAGSILLPVKVANAHVLGGGGAGAGAGAGTGGGKGGALGLLDSPLSGVAAKMFMVVKAIQLLEGGLNTTAGMMNIYGDSMLSATQKTQMMSESIPVIGGLVKAFREFGEALSGLPEYLQKGRLKIAQQAAGERAKAEARQKVNAQDLVFAGAQAKWSSLRDAPMPDAGPLARQTYQEQLAYQKSQSLLPAKEKAHVAQADLAAAQAGYAKAQEQLRAGQANIKMYRADIDKKQTMADRLFGADKGSAGEAQRKLLLEQVAASEEGLARNKAQCRGGRQQRLQASLGNRAG